MISFSGIDCAGKSTQIEKIANYLREKNVRCTVIHSRGGYTPLLESLKSLIRSDKHESFEGQTKYRASVHANPQKRKMLLWFSILDLGLYYGIWFRIVELFGTTILADRYFWDSYIDFEMKYPEIEFTKWNVWKIARAIYMKPRKALIFTIPTELSMYRSTLKHEPWPEPSEIRQDRIERYLREIGKNHWDIVIDATGSIDDVFQKTLEAIED